MLIESAVLCLALNVYQEARSEIIPGQYAVALVTMNRARGQVNRVCEEVIKPAQFSWVRGSLRRVGQHWFVATSAHPRDEKAWQLAVTIARTTIEGKVYDFTHGATFYHHVKVKPHWSRVFQPVKRIGAHVFYRATSVTRDVQLNNSNRGKP